MYRPSAEKIIPMTRGQLMVQMALNQRVQRVAAPPACLDLSRSSDHDSNSSSSSLKSPQPSSSSTEGKGRKFSGEFRPNVTKIKTNDSLMLQSPSNPHKDSLFSYQMRRAESNSSTLEDEMMAANSEDTGTIKRRPQKPTVLEEVPEASPTSPNNPSVLSPSHTSSVSSHTSSVSSHTSFVSSHISGSSSSYAPSGSSTFTSSVSSSYMDRNSRVPSSQGCSNNNNNSVSSMCSSVSGSMYMQVPVEHCASSSNASVVSVSSSAVAALSSDSGTGRNYSSNNSNNKNFVDCSSYPVAASSPKDSSSYSSKDASLSKDSPYSTSASKDSAYKSSSSPTSPQGQSRIDQILDSSFEAERDGAELNKYRKSSVYINAQISCYPNLDFDDLDEDDLDGMRRNSAGKRSHSSTSSSKGSRSSTSSSKGSHSSTLSSKGSHSSTSSSKRSRSSVYSGQSVSSGVTVQENVMEEGEAKDDTTTPVNSDSEHQEGEGSLCGSVSSSVLSNGVDTYNTQAAGASTSSKHSSLRRYELPEAAEVDDDAADPTWNPGEVGDDAADPTWYPGEVSDNAADPTWNPYEFVSDSESDSASTVIEKDFPQVTFHISPRSVSPSKEDLDAHVSSSTAQSGITGFCVQNPPAGTKKDKPHWCIFCEKSTTKLERHFLSFHKCERDLIPYLNAPKSNKKKEMSKLRNMGDHMHNMSVFEKGTGEMVVKRKRNNVIAPSVQQYVPCPVCLGYYYKKDLWRHKCSAKNKTDAAHVHSSKSMVAAGKLLIPEKPGQRRERSNDEEMARAILQHLKADEVGLVVRNDPLIFELALRETRKNGFDRDRHPYIRNKLREIGRLVIALRQTTGHANGRLSDFLKPSEFNSAVKATHEVAQYSSATSEYGVPALAMKLGHTLRRCALLLKAKAIEQHDTQLRLECSDFIELYDMKWNETVSSQASRTLYRKKQNCVKRLPLCADVQKLSAFLVKTAKDTRIQLTVTNNSPELVQAWKSLSKTVLTQVILFNRRRSGEAAKMKVSDFENRQGNKPDDVTKSLSSFEQVLCKTLVRIEIIGKRGRIVPVLLTTEMAESMEVLLNFRKQAGIPETNPFIFAQSHCQSNGHIRGSDTLRQHCAEANLEHPELMTSTSLRKHVATMTQLYNLQDHELDLVAQYMGHDIRTHRDHYRLPSATLQMAKVSKILLDMDSGHLSWSKSLNDVDVEDDIVPDEADPEEEDEEDEDDIIQDLHKRRHDEDSDYQPGPEAADTDKGSKRQKTAVPNQQARRKWTKPEKDAIFRHFRSFICRGSQPGKAEIEKCASNEPALACRTWLHVKNFIRNQGKAARTSSLTVVHD